MLNIKYAMVTDTLTLEGKSYIAYGILVLSDNTPVRYIPDVFLDKNYAVKYISLFNDLKLSPIHLNDVIDDIVGL